MEAGMTVCWLQHINERAVNIRLIGWFSLMKAQLYLFILPMKSNDL